jgi:serine/threonine protein kinase
VAGVPQLLARHGEAAFVREYVEGCNLREFTRSGQVDAQFFPRLAAILAEVHARGMSHNDLSKPENVLVASDGSPRLIDFQIATRLVAGGGPVVRAAARRWIAYMQGVDRYHLAKQNSRRRPMDFTPEQRAAMQRKGCVVTVHGWFRRPYRAVRHMVMRRLLVEPAPGAIPAPHLDLAQQPRPSVGVVEREATE